MLAEMMDIWNTLLSLLPVQLDINRRIGRIKCTLEKMSLEMGPVIVVS